jgi:hypothetical protein
MAIVTKISWDDILDGKPFPQSDARRLFCETVETAFAQASQALPNLNGRVEKARDLVLANAVIPNQDGTFTVQSQAEPGKTYTVNGSCERSEHPRCDCPDAQSREGQCKHLIATWLWRKARKMVEQQQRETALPQLPSPVEASGTPAIPAQFLTEIHGKQFVQYAGLLAMAHERGLQKLESHFISVTSDLALAEATAEFSDGKIFKECGDATPANVHPKVKPHFPRMALTRSKARALRDALNISVCSVEEMEA